MTEEETYIYQEMAVQENYKICAADRPALAVYGRYAARKKVRQIKEFVMTRQTPGPIRDPASAV